MTIAAGVVLLVLPIWFNAAFGLLAARFDYPEVLRRPPAEVLGRFAAGGTPLVLLWWVFALSALALAPAAVLLGGALAGAGATLTQLTVLAGVLAALVQLLGLVRWPLLVGELARQHAASAPGSSRRDAVEVTFIAVNRLLGVAIGEHLGYALTGLWTVGWSLGILRTDVVPSALGWPGLAVGAALLVGSLEFIGPHERDGWRAAGTVVPVAYVAWSLLLLAVGVALVA